MNRLRDACSSRILKLRIYRDESGWPAAFRRLTVIRRMVVAAVLCPRCLNGPLVRATANLAYHSTKIFVARVSIAAESLAPRNPLKLRKHPQARPVTHLPETNPPATRQPETHLAVMHLPETRRLRLRLVQLTVLHQGP
jgi:hypothetical protein